MNEVIEEKPNTDDASDEKMDAERRAEILNRLGMTLAETRSRAIDNRRQSGIEDEWEQDEEYYEGIDDTNRGEASAWRSKPPGQQYSGSKPTTSTAFLNITRPYCDAAGARTGDMLLPTDDRAFSINATPVVDELVDISKGEIPPRIQRQIGDSFKQDEQGNPVPEEKQKELVEKTTNDLVSQTKEELEAAKAKAKKAEKRIDDWHVEANFHAELRTGIDDAAKVGCGILKGPVPEFRRSVAFVNGKLKVQNELKPVSRRINYWNFYPDYPACGENIHRGNFTFERDDITRRELENLMDGNYLDHQIKIVLEEGPHKAEGTFDKREQNRPGLAKRDEPNLFEIWYYYGRLTKEQIEAAGCEVEKDEQYDVLLTMVNNRVIKAVLNPLDNGDFPYDIMIWQKRVGMPWGIGVARQIRVPQRIVNAAFRNMMDNAGIAGGPMWAFKQGIITPLNGKYEISPRKGWKIDENATQEQVEKAFTWFKLDMMVEELQAIIQLGLKFAEDVTGMPMLLQGQKGDAPDTLGGQILATNNSSTVLRRIARLADDRITEPHVRRYYTYLLQYGEDDEKGDFQIDARGSSALVERELQNQTIAGMGDMAANPAFGIDPKKWAEEMMKSQRLNPKNFQFDDEKWEEIVTNMQKSQEQPDTRMEVAQLNAKVKEMQFQHETEQADLKRQFEAEQNEVKHQNALFFKEIDAENERLKQQGQRELTVAQIQERYQEHQEKLKAELAQTSMKLKVQKELSGTQALTPPVEPKGRAPDGQSFQR